MTSAMIFFVACYGFSVDWYYVCVDRWCWHWGICTKRKGSSTETWPLTTSCWARTTKSPSVSLRQIRVSSLLRSVGKGWDIVTISMFFSAVLFLVTYSMCLWADFQLCWCVMIFNSMSPLSDYSWLWTGQTEEKWLQQDDISGRNHLVLVVRVKSP